MVFLQIVRKRGTQFPSAEGRTDELLAFLVLYFPGPMLSCKHKCVLERCHGSSKRPSYCRGELCSKLTGTAGGGGPGYPALSLWSSAPSPRPKHDCEDGGHFLGDLLC